MTDAYERKLRLVYDAIDSRNWKTAIKISNAALQKHKADQLLRSLKAWALLKSGRQGEALEVCDEVVTEVVRDEQVLQLTTMVLRTAGRTSDIIAVHEAASAAHPKDVTLLRALFGAYAREFNFAKQQQVAMKLQRLVGGTEGEYTWWAITSLVLQASVAGKEKQGGMSAAQLWKLAESMAAKQLAKGTSEGTYEAVMLYMHILREQGKVEEALKELEGSMGEAIPLPSESKSLQASLKAALGDNKGAAALAKQALVTNPDDWASLQLYLDALVPNRGPLGTDAIAEAEETLQELAASSLVDSSARKGSALRGPVLASAELALRRQAADVSAHADGEASTSEPAGLAEAVLECYKQLGHLSSCASDLGNFVAAVRPTRREWLCQQIHASWKDHALADSKLTMDHVRRQACAYQIESDLGLPAFENPQVAIAHARQLMALYRRAMPLWAELDSKERGPADELVVLAVTSLVKAWKLDASGEHTHLLQALLVLEAVQRKRKVSAGMRLAATALYSLLGHLLLPALMGGLCREEGNKLAAAITDLHETHARDCGDTLTMAYFSGNYTKVLEFVDFKRRLERSYGRIAVAAEAAVLRIEASAGSASSSEVLAVAQRASEAICASVSAFQGQMAELVRFNEDLSTRPAWLPPAPCGPSLALLDWWQRHASQPVPGSSHCWWSVTAAAECEADEAAEYRRQALAALQRRVLIPGLISQALSVSATDQLQRASQSFDALVELEGIEASQLDQRLASLPEEVAALPLTRVCQLTNLATFAAAQAALAHQVPAESRAAQNGHDSHSHTIFCARVVYLQKIALAALSRIIGDLSCTPAGHCLGVGTGCFAAAAFASDSLLWLALCLRAWTAHFVPKGKAGKKAGQASRREGSQKGTKSKSPSESNSGSRDTVNTGTQNGAAVENGGAEASTSSSDPNRGGDVGVALSSLRSAVLGELEKLQKLLHSGGSASERAAELECALSDADLAGDLWGWEEQLSARDSLQSLAEAQQAIMQRIADAVARCVKMLK